jgi:hypothetical protein
MLTPKETPKPFRWLRLCLNRDGRIVRLLSTDSNQIWVSPWSQVTVLHLCGTDERRNAFGFEVRPKARLHQLTTLGIKDLPGALGDGAGNARTVLKPYSH